MSNTTTTTTAQQQQQDPEWAPTPQAHAQYQRRPSTTTKENNNNNNDDDEEEEEDEYDLRIKRTGCSAENEALQLCYAEKHDWRQCQEAMTAFRECWKRNGNVQAEK
ncbi:hypothetical protein FBU30_008387 [Linnemannia zychae]|nr:hypothetical protein FBU30_008387 [Linnemannia zychae]